MTSIIHHICRACVTATVMWLGYLTWNYFKPYSHGADPVDVWYWTAAGALIVQQIWYGKAEKQDADA